MTDLGAFHGDQKLKDKYIARLLKHMEDDELVRGIGWEDGRGCAIGCTFEHYDHERGSEEIGLPEWLLHLGDKLHENVSDDFDWKTFWLRVLQDISPGTDLAPVRNKLTIFILDKNIGRVGGLDIERAAKDQILSAIETCKQCHSDELAGVFEIDWSAAYSAAWAAASSAASSAAWSAAEVAWSAADSAASSAAWSAAEVAWSAADSAAWAALSAAWAAEAEEATEYDAIAAELIRLLATAQRAK